jgi:eukaryotic-like serine/threonine-protein kinase
MISHYRILKELGAGGMGEVYLAEDTQLSRNVALKLLPKASVSDQNAKRRLVREARAAAKLDHPNICSVYDVGEADGHTFIAMQYVEGETLAERCRKKRLQLRECLEVAIQVTDALSEAHSRGIIHRDIKPQNIMLTDRGQVKVLDFGLAKMIPQGSPADTNALTLTEITEHSVVVGTVPYLSPEQIHGQGPDVRSDIFSLGVVVYEIVTGHRPFTAEDKLTLIWTILRKEPEPLSRYVSGLPTELDRIVQKCLEKDGERRYQSARELGLDLRKLQESVQAGSKGAYQRQRQKRPGWIALTAIAAVLLVIAILGLSRLALWDRAVGKQIGSIAVLPFANDGADPKTDYLSDGITEGLINNLSQLPNLKVSGRNSVYHYKGRNVDVFDVGKELRVGAVLSGRVRQLGDELSISVELTDARDKSHIWGEQYKRKLADIFVLQEAIAKEISEKLRLKLSGEQSARLLKRHTDNLEAYEFYTRGRYLWNRRTPEDVSKAADYFKQALAKDPAYALAHAGLADSYSLLGDYGALPAKEAFRQAEAAARDALRLDPTLAEAYTSLAHVRLYDWNWTRAEEEYRQAIALNPNYATAHQWYANHLVAMGRMEEAQAEIKLALEIDPLSFIINEVAGRHLYLMRQYDQAIERHVKVLELEPTFIPAHAALGLAYVQKGNYEQAISQFKKAIDLSGNPAYTAELAHAYAVSGQKSRAREMLHTLISPSRQRYLSPYYIAALYVGLGEAEQAVDWLEKAFDDRSSELMFIKQEPIFAPLRSHSRFQDLLQRIGLP